ncbi:hypothetical protein GALMADRAFT_213443 [Galerina marginata CBS 339.88]|uniref:Uncharacterized protein n=1 Tax=Galerina marginata (strain CBS 339.88) TaxID=685588 RepID=A0A067SWC0_GALM3|nr:hypothetical protein GALMADRAFT_213443 [Galerina marginata CBS 339.88]
MERFLRADFIPDFNNLFKKPNHNILRPNEDENEDVDAEEENLQNLVTIVTFAADIEGDQPESSFEISNKLDINGLELDLDNYFSDGEDLNGEDEPKEPEIFSWTLKEGNNEYLKSALIASLHPNDWKKILVHPFQVQGKTMESIYSNSRSLGELETTREKMN